MPTLPHDLFFLLDPHQRAAVQMAAEGQNAWIHGSDRNKRLQVMSQLIITRIFEGGTVLVCAGEETEKSIMEMLRSVGLDSSHFHLRSSVTKAGMAALQLAKKKNIKDDTHTPTSLALQQYSRWNEKLVGRYSATNRRIFGDLTWQQLAEKAATGPDASYKGLLAASLNASELRLDLKEYWQVRGRIKTFQRLSVLRTPAFDQLDALHEQIFEESNQAVLRDHTMTTLQDVINKGRQLLARVGTLVHQYRRDVSGQHQEVLHALRCEIDRLDELLEQGVAKYGNGFISESTFGDITGRIRQSISRKYSEVNAARQEAIQNYRDLMEHLNGTMFASDPTAAWNVESGLETMRQRLESLREYLTKKACEIEANALKNKKRLNAHNISRSHALQGNISEVEEAIDTFVFWVNALKILSEPIEINALSLDKKSAMVQHTVLQCSRLLEAMVDFEAYYLWRNFWKQQSDLTRTLLQALEILEPQDQMDAYDAWYFENVLDQVPESHMTPASLPLEERRAKLRDLRAVVGNHIRVQLQNSRYQALREVKHKSKTLHTAIANARLNTVSDELHIHPAQSLCKLFPVVFCTPGQLRDYGYYFDTLLVADNNGGDFKAYQAQSKQCVFVTASLPSNIVSTHAELQTAKLQVTTFSETFTWNDLPASERLHMLNTIASQFAPYTDCMKIYNAREVQIFSFLGEIADQFILTNLQMPYKVTGEGQALSTKHITESLLDSSKPIILLTRDSIMHFGEGQDLFWQQHVIQLLRECRLQLINNSSLQLKTTGLPAMMEIVERIQTQPSIAAPRSKASEEARKHA